MNTLWNSFFSCGENLIFMMLKYSCEVCSAHNVRNYWSDLQAHKHWHVYNTENVLIIPKINHIRVIIYRYLLIKILAQNLKQTRDIIYYLLSNMKIQLLYSWCLKFLISCDKSLREDEKEEKKFFRRLHVKILFLWIIIFFPSPLLHFRQ